MNICVFFIVTKDFSYFCSVLVFYKKFERDFSFRRDDFKDFFFNCKNVRKILIVKTSMFESIISFSYHPIFCMDLRNVPLTVIFYF